MTLNQLIYFCKLAELEHYSNAAKALFISQPSLSKAMAQLERELGVALFHRKGRNVVLTEAGRTFYDQIIPALHQIDQARNSIERYSNRQRRPVFGCVSPAVTAVMVPLLKAYRDEGYDDPRPEVRVETSEALVSALRAGGCDLAFCTRIPEASGVSFISLAYFPFVVVMRDDDPLAACEYVTPEMLEGRPMAFTYAPAYNAVLDRIFKHYNVTPVVHSYANDDVAMFGAVRAGTALFITSDYPQLYSNGLAIRLLKQDVCQREICLAYTDESLLSPAADLIRYFQDCYDLLKASTKHI